LHDDTADRHFAALCRGFRLLERQLLVVRLGHARLRRCRVLRALHPHDFMEVTRHPMTRKPEKKAANAGERIAKVMARAGLCSRRDAETWIGAGRVSVNGQRLASPAYNVKPGARVEADGDRLPPRGPPRPVRCPP